MILIYKINLTRNHDGAWSFESNAEKIRDRSIIIKLENKYISILEQVIWKYVPFTEAESLRANPERKDMLMVI